MTNLDSKTSRQTSPGATLFIVSAVQFLTPFMMSAVGVALPTIGQVFNASAVSLGLVEMVYILAVALLLLPAGRLADIYGRKKIFITGASVFTIATALIPFASTIEMFIGFRFFQGAGASLIVSTSVAILSAVFPPDRMGRAMGVVVGCVYAGLSAGPTLAGLMITYLGWEWIFFATVPIAFSALLLTVTKLKGEWVGAKGASFDGFGAVIYMVSLFCLIFGASHLRNGSWAVGMMVFGCLGIAVFFVFEMKHPSPILDVRLILNNRVFAFSNIATWINYASSFGLTFFFSLYLQVVKGMTPQATGFILIIQPVIQAVLSPVAGTLSDKYSPAKLATIGMTTCAAGLGFAAFTGLGSGISMVVLILIIMGFGFAMFSTPNMTTVMGSVGPEHYGVASSLVATMRSTGMLTAMTLITILLGFFMGDAGVSNETIPEFLKTMRTGFALFAAMSLFGIIFSMARISANKPEKQTGTDSDMSL